MCWQGNELFEANIYLFVKWNILCIDNLAEYSQEYCFNALNDVFQRFND